MQSFFTVAAEKLPVNKPVTLQAMFSTACKWCVENDVAFPRGGRAFAAMMKAAGWKRAHRNDGNVWFHPKAVPFASAVDPLF